MLNYYKIFRKKLLEQEVRSKIETESTLEKILKSSKKITSVLTSLLTSQKKYNEQAKNEIREIISDVRFISYKPTTFRIIMKNGNFFDLKYDPTPIELKNPDEFKPEDSFLVLVSGKRYSLSNNSEKNQAIDYINDLLKSAPLAKQPAKEEPPAPEEAPEPGAEETPPEGEETASPEETEEAPKK